MRGSRFAVVLMLASLLSACVQHQGNKQTVGTLLGAGTGALIGSQMGSGKGKLAMVALGALGGAFLGGEIGKSMEKGGDAAVVESVKAASEIYAPLDGEVVEVNEALGDDPAPINSDPQGEGWFFKMTIADASQLEGLMDETAYKAHVAALE